MYDLGNILSRPPTPSLPPGYSARGNNVAVIDVCVCGGVTRSQRAEVAEVFSRLPWISKKKKKKPLTATDLFQSRAKSTAKLLHYFIFGERKKNLAQRHFHARFLPAVARYTLLRQVG